MSVSPLIHLPMLPDNHTFSDDKLEFFYNSSGKLVIPPVFFNLGIKQILKRLTKQVTDQSGTSRLELTEVWDKWTEEAFVAYPFFDTAQRDELNRPFVKYAKTYENKLKFAIHMQLYFGTAKQCGRDGRGEDDVRGRYCGEGWR